MQLLEDGVIAALAALGLMTLLYLAVSAFLRPRGCASVSAFAAVPCRAGDAAALEQTVRALERARYEYGGFCRIVILDCGMGEEEKEIAALLCRESYDVALREPAALPKEWE